MATQTVQPGGGNWSNAGTWSSGVPAIGDDVVLNATSGQLTIDVSTNNIRSLVSTGYTNTLTHNAGVTLNIGTSTAPVGNVALLFVGTETYTLGSSTTSAIAITDTSGATNTYNFAGLTLGNVTIANSSTTTTQLTTSGFSMANTATLTLTSGGLDFNGQTCTIGLFSSSNTNTRSVNCGAANITISGTSGTPWSTSTSTNLTFSAGTSTITVTGSGITFGGGTVTYNNLVFSPTATATVAITIVACANLTISPSAGMSPAIEYNTTSSTITGTFTVTGSNNGTTQGRVLFQNNNPSKGNVSTISAAAVSLTQVDFCDITGSGAASPWSGTSIGNAGGNTNINFANTRTLYWVNNTGNYNSTNQWSLSSGGASGVSIPLPQDTVIFDNNSIKASGQTITVGGYIMGGNVSFASVLNNPKLSISNNATYICGNLVMASGMTATGNVIAFGGRGAQTITSAGVTLPSVAFSSGVGSYTLNDNLVSSATLSHNSGTFNANGMNVTCSNVTENSGSLRSLLMGSGTWTLNATSGNAWALTTTNLTFNAQTSTIVCNSLRTTALQFQGGGVTYNNVTFSQSGDEEGSYIITGNNTFNQLTINSPNNVFFTNGSVTTCKQFIANGVSSGAIVIRSTVNNYQWYLDVLAGYSVSNVDLRDSNASGSAIQP